jgi:phosphatidate cytidylyltransferase
LTLLLVVGIFATRELLGLLPATTRPQLVLALPAVWLLLVAHWLPQIPDLVVSPWAVVVATLAGAILVLFLLEMWQYREPGIASARIANTLFVLAYLGILPGFLARIRLDIPASGAALLATIFVPKFTDVGAYLTGRALGRTPLTRRLSPKKTWEGFAGGLVFGVGTALGFHAWTDVFSRGLVQAVAFGLILAVLGTLGDLAESMIKRDGMLKDSSQAIPGFGGILDVIDSVIFVAPVAYWLLIL